MRERGRKHLMRKRGCGRPSLELCRRAWFEEIGQQVAVERLGELSGDVVLSFPGLILMDE
jgi:hypothetical protein